MMNTCQSHPKYGKAESFREELKGSNLRVQEIERVLQGLKMEHADIDRKLESLKHRTGGGGASSGNSEVVYNTLYGSKFNLPSLLNSAFVGASSSRQAM